MEISNWLPADYVHRAARLGGEEFGQTYGDTFFLLVKLESAKPKLVTGLAATSTLEVPADLLAEEPGVGTDVMSTCLSDDLPTAVAVAPGADAAADRILQRVGSLRCFVVPLQARVGQGVGGALSVGRAPNNDVVFRDSAVSQHHAWFVRDRDGGMRVCDLGSKNGTRLNGKSMRDRDEPVRAGDVIAFGRVEAVVCDGPTLWRVLRASLPSR